MLGLDPGDKRRHDTVGGIAHEPPDAIERLAELANADAWLVHRGRFLDDDVPAGGRQTPTISCASTAAASRPSTRGPFVHAALDLRAAGLPRKPGTTFWRPVPPPGVHDLIAMIKTRALRLEGDQYPFMANLRYFKDLLALPRRPRREVHDEPRPSPHFEPPSAATCASTSAASRTASTSRRPAKGIPLVCLHTAGADGRQYRGLLNDRRDARALPRHRLRSAVARQVLAAGGLAEGRVQADLARLRRHHHGRGRRARPRQAGGDGLLHRRPHRAAPGARARHALPRPDRPGVRRPRRALLRPRLAAPPGRAWRRGVRRP